MAANEDDSDLDGGGPSGSQTGPKLRRSKRKIVIKISEENSDSDQEKPIGRRSKEAIAKTKVVEATETMEEFSDHSVWEEDWISDDNNMDDNESVASSSDGRDSCAICLFVLAGQEVGRPEICDHKFCAICIEEWSKNVSTCPIDRLEFRKIICTRNIQSNEQTREILVDKEKNKLDDLDLGTTNCEICGQSDREDRMLLCDDCDRGFHMDCLTPVLTEIPSGLWFCRECSDTDDEDDGEEDALAQEDIQRLLNEVRLIGINENQVTIRTETTVVPRITRTSQSERIRNAILARTNRRSFRDYHQNSPSSIEELDLPGPSRMTTTAQFVSEIPVIEEPYRPRRAPVRRRARRRRQVNRTVVVEYDVNDENDKFAMTTKKIYKRIKRRRRRRRQMPQTNRENLNSREYKDLPVDEKIEFTRDLAKDELSLRRLQAGIPRLSLTGSRNQVDYYLSDDDNDGDDSGFGSGLLTATRSRNLNLARNVKRLRNQKGGLIIPESSMSSAPDLLSSIMDEQERWFNISNRNNIGNIKIKSDGSLEFKPDKNIQSAPLNSNSNAVNANSTPIKRADNAREGSSTGDTSGGGGGGEGSSTTPTTRSSSSSSSSFSSNLNSQDGGGNNSGNNMNFPARISFGRTPPSQRKLDDRNKLFNFNSNKNSTQQQQQSAPQLYDPEDLNDVDGKKEALNNGQSDGTKEKKDSDNLSVNQSTEESSLAQNNSPSKSSEDDCPNFSVYSAEAVKLASKKHSDSEPEEGNKPEPGQDCEEKEEDLVQLDDDDEENQDQSNGQSQEKRDAFNGTNKKCVLELMCDDSDWEDMNNEKLDEQKSDKKGENEDRQGDIENQLNTESISDEDHEPDERSFTPCLDENQPIDEDEEENQHPSKAKSEKTDDGISGLETELISDDEIPTTGESNEDKKGKKKGDAKNDTNKKEDEFKKISRNNKGRNYRDKDRSRSRGRHHSKEKSNQDRLKKGKRKDLERYDVRNLIADRKSKPIKDKYGRDTTRAVSRSRSRSCSLSSLSPRRSSRSRSRSRHRRSRKSQSRSPKRRQSWRSKSPRKRRSRSRKTVSPRKKRSVSRFTMSPSLSRSPSPRYRSDRKVSNYKRSPQREKEKRSLNNGREHNKNKSKLPSSIERSLSPELPPIKKRRSHREKRRSRNRSRSVSLSPVRKSPTRSVRNVVEEYDKSWTPPLDNPTASPVTDKLKVILKNTSKIVTGNVGKSKKKEKRKRGDKRRDSLDGKKEKRSKKRTASSPAKEVIASGDNIVVNLNFGKETLAKPQQTTIVTLPPSKDQIMTQKRRNEKRELLKESSRKNSSKSKTSSIVKTNLVVTKRKRHRKVDTKPVAIIDLDRSPFKEMTPSPKAVIILSDSDPENSGKGTKVTDNSKINSKKDADLTKKGKSSNSRDFQNRKTDEIITTTITDQDSSFEMDLLESSLGANGTAKSANSGSNLSSQSGGPKTPPEPVLKFSMAVKSKNVLRTVNPLHEDEQEPVEESPAQIATSVSSTTPTATIPPEYTFGQTVGNTNTTSDLLLETKEGCDSDSNVELDVNISSQVNNSINSNANKIGPNTPPEPAPSSPDAYDPFEPTKSNSQSPSQKDDTESNTNTNSESRPADKSSVNPVDLVLKLINSSSTSSQQHQTDHLDVSSGHSNLSKQSPTPEKMEQTPTKSNSIQILSNVVIQPGKVAVSESNNPIPTSMSSTLYCGAGTTYSMLKQQSSATKNLYKGSTATASATLTTTPTQPTLTRALLKRHNAEQHIMTELADSPYSPGSSDFDDLFEPPLDVSAANRQSAGQSRLFSGTKASPMKPAAAATAGANKGQAELFDSLFGTSSPPQGGASQPWNPSKIRKPTHGHHENRQHRRSSSHVKDDSLRVGEDLPNSACDLQILKKIHRQERVVEEVKLVLKPHFNKKRITKEDYKEILRKSVPKICHSRTGEINPTKIKALIEAYVKKYRYKRKHMSDGPSSVPGSAPTSSTTTMMVNQSK